MPDKRYPPPPEKKNDEFQAKKFIDFNFMRKIVIFVWITLTDFLKMDYLTSILRDEIGQAKLGNFLTMFQSKSP